MVTVYRLPEQSPEIANRRALLEPTRRESSPDPAASLGAEKELPRPPWPEIFEFSDLTLADLALPPPPPLGAEYDSDVVPPPLELEISLVNALESFGASEAATEAATEAASEAASEGLEYDSDGDRRAPTPEPPHVMLPIPEPAIIPEFKEFKIVPVSSI